MSAWLSHRLTANPVSLSPASWASQRPRSPLRVLPFVRTFSRYVRSKSFHAPARNFPQVTRITMAASLPTLCGRRYAPPRDPSDVPVTVNHVDTRPPLRPASRCCGLTESPRRLETTATEESSGREL